MQKYIKIFLITSIILFFIYTSCGEQTPAQSPYEEAQLIGYSSSDSCVTRLRQIGDSAEVEIVVDSFDIHIIHKNAILNCCPNSIEVEFIEEEIALILFETDNGGSCYCTCPFEITAEIGVAEAGSYLIVIFTKDRLVYQKWIEVPQ